MRFFPAGAGIRCRDSSSIPVLYGLQPDWLSMQSQPSSVCGDDSRGRRKGENLEKRGVRLFLRAGYTTNQVHNEHSPIKEKLCFLGTSKCAVSFVDTIVVIIYSELHYIHTMVAYQIKQKQKSYPLKRRLIKLNNS